MNAALALAGLALGVTASPHCAVMCGAPCAAMTNGCTRSTAGFHLGRMLGYALAGGVAAGSVAALARLSEAAPALRPLWLLMQLGVFALGLWWLATGRQPQALMRDGGVVPLHVFRKGRRPLKATIAGLLWVALPCAALQGALLLAALASDVWTGALVMLLFSLASTPALALAPWVWARWRGWAVRGGRSAPDPAQVSAWGLRVAGGGLVLMSGWALTQGVWMRVAAWCAAA